MYPRKATPLIIVGRQRSGTRFLTDILNSFADVAIQAELPNPVMRAAEQMIRSVDAFYSENAATGPARHQVQLEGWLKKREYLIFSIWENASQGSRVRFNSKTRYIGYKRPNNESYFDFYEASFRFRPPFYIYCTRNFVDNYLSIVSRWPERTIEQVAADYLESTAQYHRMTVRAPERTLLFNLDDYISQGLQYIEDRILAPLGLPLGKEHRRKLNKVSARNRTAEDLKLPRRKGLTTEEQDFIHAHPQVEREFEKLSLPYERPRPQ